MTTLTRTAFAGPGRHVARRGIRSLFSIRSMMMTGLAILVAVGLAIVATGGTYALWNKSQATGSSAVIKAGDAKLTVTTPLTFPTAVISPASPTLYGSAIVSNGGDVLLTLRTGGLTVPVPNAFTDAITVGFATASSAANCAAATGWVYSTFASPKVGPIGTVAAGQTSVICVSVKFTGTPDIEKVQGQSALNFVASIDGIQN